MPEEPRVEFIDVDSWPHFRVTVKQATEIWFEAVVDEVWPDGGK